MIATNKPLSQTGNDVADQAAQGADSAIRSTQRYANDALNTLSDKVQEVRDQAAPVLNRVAEKAETLARRGVDYAKESSQQLRERAQRVSDSTVGYIKDEPVKSILIAAATGAALMALISLMTRSRRD
jgi:ElaB/YqjD/DUF883 family membrane-anchored ribosome-binding protein